MKIKMGCTRIVLVLKNKAIKIPNFRYSWQHFLQGLLCNIHENKTWKFNGYPLSSKAIRDDLLCPVIWCSRGGWLLVMQCADVEKHQMQIQSLEPEDDIFKVDDWRKEYYKKWINAGFGGDDKPDNYGVLDGRIVKLDYGQS